VVTDPEFAAQWRDLRNGLARMLAPYVPEARVRDVAGEIVAELIAGPGWRAPLEVRRDRRRRLRAGAGA